LCTPHLQQACIYGESEKDIVEYSRLPPHQQQRGDEETRTAGVADNGTARVIQSPTMRSLALAHPPEGTQLVRKEPKPAVKARRHLSCARSAACPSQNCAGMQNAPGCGVAHKCMRGCPFAWPTARVSMRAGMYVEIQSGGPGHSRARNTDTHASTSTCMERFETLCAGGRDWYALRTESRSALRARHGRGCQARASRHARACHAPGAPPPVRQLRAQSQRRCGSG
jgi:hypothetical protein